MKSKKEGISLIVLVITIVIMIILAGTIILTLTNNNIISKANTTMTDYNGALVTEQVNMYAADYLLENSESISEPNKVALKKAIEVHGIPIDKLFIYKDKDNKQLVLYKYNELNATERALMDLKGYLYLKGDVNFDNKLTEEDRDLIMQFSVGTIPTENQKNLADMNNSTNVDAIDAMLFEVMLNGHSSLLQQFGITDQTIID